MLIGPSSLTFEQSSRLYHASLSSDKTSSLPSHAVLTLAPFSPRVCSVWFIWFVLLLEQEKPNKPNKRGRHCFSLDQGGIV